MIEVFDIDENKLSVDVICSTPIENLGKSSDNQEQSNQPEKSNNQTEGCEAYFKGDLGSYGFSYYRVEFGNRRNREVDEFLVESYPIRISLVGNRFLTMLDPKTFSLEECSSSSCKELKFSVDYKYYQSAQTRSGQNSGAYIFREDWNRKNTEEYQVLPKNDYFSPTSVRVLKGDVTTQIWVIYNILIN